MKLYMLNEGVLTIWPHYGVLVVIFFFFTLCDPDIFSWLHVIMLDLKKITLLYFFIPLNYNPGGDIGAAWMIL